MMFISAWINRLNTMNGDKFTKAKNTIRLASLNHLGLDGECLYGGI